MTPLDGPFDPLALDRELERAARRWRVWRRSLREGSGIDQAPFEPSRAVLGVTTFSAVDRLPDSDPLKLPLKRWIYRLAEQRIDREALLAVEIARQAPQLVDRPEHAKLSLSAMLRRALVEGPRLGAWLSAYLEHCRELAAATALLWQRRREVGERMGVGATQLLEWPSASLESIADAWLVESREAAQELVPAKNLAELVDHALGAEANEGWPARVSPRSLSQLLADTLLLDRVSIDPGRLPAALAASSFLRALARVGAAWRDALAPNNQPFVIAHDAYGLERRQSGALFAGLPLNLRFLRKSLGLGSARSREHRRALGKVLLIESRAAALRVLLRGPALQGAEAFGEAFESRTERTFGFALPKTAAGALFRLHVDDGQRFAGLLGAARQAQELVETHDEDWFFNPRAADQLRSEAALSPSFSVDQSVIEAGARALASTLAEAFR